MKLIKYTAGAALLSGVASAQGLFDVNPNQIESESLPLKYSVGVSVGYDDNLNSTSGLPEETSFYVKGTLGANIAVRGPRTSWDVNAEVGATHYLDDVTTSDTVYNARLAFNLNHQLSDRTRFVSRNFVNYGRDLGSTYGPITSQQLDEYLYISTDQAIGYRWTDRLATYTGVTYSSLDYDGSVNDIDSYGVYNTFRYSLSPQTVLTATYRWVQSEYSSGNDSSTQYATVGLEHKVSDTAVIAGEVGAQFGSATSPYGQLTYRNRINNQLKVSAFARYGLEDTDTVFPGGRYEEKTTLRIGAAADYTVSPQLVLTVGGSYTQSDYSQGGALADGDWDLFNVYVGATYKVNDALSLRATVNHTSSDASATVTGRDYDRNRYELGAVYTF